MKWEEGEWKERDRAETKAKQGRGHLKGYTGRVNLEFSQVGNGMKLKVVFALRRKDQKKNNNQFTNVEMNQLLLWNPDSQSACLKFQHEVF